ncbi:hypothetical protein E2562_009299 [Oryza meyeriana var. granulata]|uniref:Uncharacterized protein n=1 Tax=Oryza meyeriana var. granulata TaxID=110450 RepID=A0A6G1CF48_9ORYZ|nr:hypothetical protein E2562_009299 [Oryza meyeriana var. granulata]
MARPHSIDITDLRASAETYAEHVHLSKYVVHFWIPAIDATVFPIGGQELVASSAIFPLRRLIPTRQGNLMGRRIQGEGEPESSEEEGEMLDPRGANLPAYSCSQLANGELGRDDEEHRRADEDD